MMERLEQLPVSQLLQVLVGYYKPGLLELTQVNLQKAITVTVVRLTIMTVIMQQQTMDTGE
jgi:hypothetical protein